MKKNNTAKKSVIEAEKITTALKEETQKSLQNILSEALSNVISEEDEEEVETTEVEEPTDDTSYDVEDVKTDDEGNTDETEEVETTDEEDPEADAEGEDDEWSDDIEQYKVGDNEFDLTGLDAETAAKFFSKIDDEDTVSIVKKDDGKVELTTDDGEDSLVIDFSDSEGDDVEGDDTDEDDFELELGDEEGEDETDDDADDEDFEIDLGDDTEDVDDTEDDDVEFEFDGEVEDDDEEDKIDEAATTVSQQPTRKATKSQTKQHRPNNTYEVAKEDSPLSESAREKIKEMLKPILAENKQYKETINSIRESVKSTCANYARLIDLLVNESATRDEKRKMVERFAKVKSDTEGKQLFESVKIELSKSHKNYVPRLDEQISVAPAQTAIKETVMKHPTYDLMERLDRLDKMNRRRL